MARSAILFLDTNILLDSPQPRDYQIQGRQVTLVVIPEVMRELRGLSRSPDRGQAGSALQALAIWETLAQRRGGRVGVPVGRPGVLARVPLGSPDTSVAVDLQLVLRAKAEQSRQRGALVAVVTKDWGVAELARSERVRSVLLRGNVSPRELQRGVAEHDTALDIDL